MPLVRVASQLVYFAHVPKCAGTSIEDYLRRRFGMVAMLDRNYLSRDPDLRWSKSSPQHIAVADLGRMFPIRFFDAKFAVVRHPVDRITSVFLFQRDVQGTIPEGQSMEEWLQGLDAAIAADEFLYDNHVRPMADFIPAGTDVFRLEEGLDRVISWLDSLAGDEGGPREMARRNTRATRPGGTEPFEVSADARALIAEIFARDFEQYGYQD